MRIRASKALSTFLLIGVVFNTGNAALIAVDTVAVAGASGNPGDTGVLVTLNATNDLAMQGFSVAVTYATAPLNCTGASIENTIVETQSPLGEPEYFQFLIDDAEGTIIAGVILDLDPVGPVEIPPSPAVAEDLIHLIFDVEILAVPGDYDIELTDGIGNPPVSNMFSSDGVSIFPELLDGMFTVDNPYCYFFKDVSVDPGGGFLLYLSLAHIGDVQGFQVSMIWDNSDFNFFPWPDPMFYWQGTDLGAEMQEQGATVESFGVTYVEDLFPGTDWIGFIVVFDFVPPFMGQVLPPSATGQTILVFNFTLSPDVGVGNCALIDLVNGVGAPEPIDNVLAIGGLSFPVLLKDAEICPQDDPTFIRGDANDDTSINIADAIFIINYLFVQGPPPNCFDAADSNNDEGIDVSDVIYMIQWQFADGLPPPFPWPNCGADPQGDTLGCTSFIGC